MSELADTLHANGRRLTASRRRILRALREPGHATADEIAAAVARDGAAPLALSTVYRCLDVLAELGLVGQSRLDDGVPSYYLASHADHLHLTCRTCGAIDEAAASVAASLVAALEARSGFAADVSHLTIPGWCHRCRQEGRGEAVESSEPPPSSSRPLSSLAPPGTAPSPGAGR